MSEQVRLLQIWYGGRPIAAWTTSDFVWKRGTPEYAALLRCRGRWLVSVGFWRRNYFDRRC